MLIRGAGAPCLSSFVSHGFTDPPVWIVGSLTVPATVGEFWMIGYLLAVNPTPC
jgi:hypothetical protein